MSWAGGTFEFNEDTKQGSMMAEITESLDMERGAMEPVHLPLKLLHFVARDRDEAEEKLSELYPTYGRKYNYGVRFKEFPELTSKKADDLKRRVRETEEKKVKYTKEHSIKMLKAQYISCSKCGSKLNRELLNGETCPLCRNDLRSDTTKSTLAGYTQKISDLNKQLKAEERKLQEKAVAKRTMKWLVHAEVYIG